MRVLFGWPREMQGNNPIWGRCATPCDIDGNFDWEFSLITTEGRLYLFQHDGAHFPGFPLPPHQGGRPQNWVNPRHNATSAAGDIDGDSIHELVYITDIGFLHVVEQNEAEPEPFPVDLGRNITAGVPALADIDGDNDIDIVFNTFYLHPDSAEVNALMHVYNNLGSEIEGFPVEYPRGSKSSPAVGDINGDDRPEIIAGNARRLGEFARIYAWRSDGALVDGFPVGSFETVNGAPTLADVDNDGLLDIIFWASEAESETAGIYAYNGHGELIDGFPLECSVGHPEGSPAVADITGDESPEIVFGAFDAGDGAQVYAWSINGDPVENYPAGLNRSVVGSVLLADVSGDGIPDVVFAASPVDESGGLILALDNTGAQIPGFPISTEDYNARAFAATPTIWDIDRDGDLDLIAATVDLKVLVWDTPGRITDNVWLTYKGNIQRTGVRQLDQPNRVTPTKRQIPGDMSLSVFPNPFNPATTIEFRIPEPGNVQIDLLDIRGGLVGNIYNGFSTEKSFELRLDLRKKSLSAGIYFCRMRYDSNSTTLKLLFIQ